MDDIISYFKISLTDFFIIGTNRVATFFLAPEAPKLTQNTERSKNFKINLRRLNMTFFERFFSCYAI